MTAGMYARSEADHHAALSRRLRGRVVSSESLGSMTWLSLEVPGWPAAFGGQFAMLRPEPSRSFLARPLSIADQSDGRVSFLVSPVGEGTRELCGLGAGSTVWVLGPLGNGFDLDRITGGSRLVVVAGGVGAAPFPLLLSQLADESVRTPAEILVLLGFRDAGQALGAGPVVQAVSRLEQAGLVCRLVVVTEDGSHGPPESVTETLSRELRADDRLAVCGPPAMSVAVWTLCCAVPDVQAWFSLEAVMACGVGSCQGCVLALADGSLQRVCHEGPVFRGDKIFGREVPPVGPIGEREDPL